MPVGLPIDKSTIDMTSGNFARQIQIWAARVPDFKAWLDTMPDADLEKPPFNYTEQEVALLKSAVNDMYILSQVWLGKMDHTPASPLNTFAERIAGIPAAI